MGHILSEEGGGGGDGGKTYLPWEVGGWRSEVAAAFSGFKACWRLRFAGSQWIVQFQPGPPCLCGTQ